VFSLSTWTDDFPIMSINREETFHFPLPVPPLEKEIIFEKFCFVWKKCDWDWDTTGVYSGEPF